MQPNDRRILNPGRHPHLVNLVRLARTTLCLAALGLASCATGPGADAPPVDAPPPTEEPIVLSPEGERYLRNMFIFACAREYVPFDDGEGPPLPTRTAAERAKREQELLGCMTEVSEEYTQLETIHQMTWNGSTHVMGNGEMQGIVRDGPAYLDEYVRMLVAAEQTREGTLSPAQQQQMEMADSESGQTSEAN